jgi:hypothetical protein
VNILSSFAMYGIRGDPCMLFTGASKCQPGAETYAARTIAIAYLWMGVSFLVLTYINKENVPKLRRLVNMTINAVFAMLVATIFFGPTSLGGSMSPVIHLIDMVYYVILLVIMRSAICQGEEMIATNSVSTGLGVNSKTFLLIVAILTAIKVFLLSDFLDLSIILANPESITALSHIMWQSTIVMLLILLIPICFALLYGDGHDQEAIAGTTILMMNLSIISFIPISDSMYHGAVAQSWIGIGIFSLFGLVMIFVGRSNNRGEYQSVSNVGSVA